MALVRILVDGYSLLQSWSEIAPGKPRHSEIAREELINHLTQYFDITGTPVTIIFDSGHAEFDENEATPSEDVEILFSRPGQSAPQMLENLAHKSGYPGEFLIVTNGNIHREPLQKLGGTPSSCESFAQTVSTVLADMEREIEKINQTENQKFSCNG